MSAAEPATAPVGEMYSGRADDEPRALGPADGEPNAACDPGGAGGLACLDPLGVVVFGADILLGVEAVMLVDEPLGDEESDVDDDTTS